MTNDHNPWRCAYCDTGYVVQSLARACEARHEAEAHDEQTW